MEIPRHWASSLVVAGTHREIVLGSGDFTDHKVVYAKVRMRAPGARTDLLRKPRVCDVRAAVEGGYTIEKFRDGLAKAPEIPKWVGIDAHAELLAKWHSFPSQHTALENRGLPKGLLPSLRRSSQCLAS